MIMWMLIDPIRAIPINICETIVPKMSSFKTKIQQKKFFK